MDFERKDTAQHEPVWVEQGLAKAPGRAQSSLRLMYAAEIKVFRAQHGGLEAIRLKLGLSRRKMCQLLMVDPSAWTRWSRDEGKVPPHIYRALEWFMALNEKALTNPQLTAVFTARYKTPAGTVSSGAPDLTEQVLFLKNELKRQQKTVFCLIAGLFCLGFALIGMFLSQAR